MQGMWIALTQNMNCGNKVTDVARLPAKWKSSRSGRKPECELTDGTENLVIQPRFRQNHLRKRFYGKILDLLFPFLAIVLQY